MYHVNVNVNLIVEKFNSNQKWNNDKVDASVKNIIYVKKIIFWILVHVTANIVNISQVFLTIQ